MPACGWSDFVIACSVLFCSDVMTMPMGYCLAAVGWLGVPARADTTALSMC